VNGASFHDAFVQLHETVLKYTESFEAMAWTPCSQDADLETLHLPVESTLVRRMDDFPASWP
jgi:hypothetical protein